MTEYSLVNALEKSVESGKNLKDFKIKQIVQNAKSQLKKDCIFHLTIFLKFYLTSIRIIIFFVFSQIIS